MKDNCYTCRYWDGLFCRRRPPFCVNALGAAKWPVTLAADWCGEYKKVRGRLPRAATELPREG